MSAPQTVNRYAYAVNSPIRYEDVNGNRPYEPGYNVHMEKGKWVYTKIPTPAPTPTPAPRINDNCSPIRGCNTTPVAPKGPTAPPKNDKPKAEEPADNSDHESDRHAVDQFLGWLDGLSFIMGIVSTVANVAAWVLLVTGVGAAISSVLFLVGKIAGAISAISGCVVGLLSLATKIDGFALGGCFLSVVAAVVGVSLGNIRSQIKGLTRREIRDAVKEFDKIAAGVGMNLDLAGLLLSVVGKIASN